MHTLVVVKPWNSPWQQKINFKTEQLKSYYQNLDKNISWLSQTLGMSSPTSTWHFLDSYDATVYFNLTVLHGVKVTEKIYLHTLLIKQTNRQTLLLIKFIVVWSQPLVGCHSFRQEC